jgi:hypothetical protein
MAKYDVDHTCGHSQTHTLFGPHKEQDRKLDWLATTLCTDCWRAEQDRQKQEASAAAAEANQSAGLPALSGSPKQIAWAESIRRPVCACLQSLDLTSKGDLPAEVNLEIADAQVLLVDEIVQQASAKWWIDNRDRFYVGKSVLIDNEGPARWIVNTAVKRGLAPALAALVAERQTAKAVQQ